MKRTVEAVAADFSTVRTGRATPALLDRVRVDYYGQEMPINQLATISIPESRLIVIQPWDKSVISAIEKAILTSDLNLTPNSDGTIIRLAIPALTEERRGELTKLVHKMAEDGRIAIRNVRRDTNSSIDAMEKKESLSEDEVRRGKQEVQDLTDKYVRKIDEAAEARTEEIMEV
ncbi:MAG TPA: ribosome recycling factor [Armatimonadetes bacterium]|nr:ribosome recycling factor [Armatimonadota bacterium]